MKNRTFIYLLVLVLISAMLAYLDILNSESILFDYIAVFVLGTIFSAVELGSRYKDEPLIAVTSSPGIFYMISNAVICCFGLYIILVFGLSVEIDDSFPLATQRTADVLYASLGSFFIMRSSFLKLGNDANQLDFGLNIVLKKLLEMVERQVDRYRAQQRSSDITRMLADVEYSDVTGKLKEFCLQIMQNLPTEERDKIMDEINKITILKACDETKKLSAGLILYTVVGRKVMTAAIADLKLQKAQATKQTDGQDSSSHDNSRADIGLILKEKFDSEDDVWFDEKVE